MEETTDNILLTFVVPCYNVEKYIQRCLDSIYACRLPESCYEVLCVNDCSPDRTAEVLERNKVFHSNFHIVNHKVNKGLGGGRNTGILNAKGRYLWFVDSDDEVVGNGFSEALKKTVDEDLDVLCFNYCRIDEEGRDLSLHIVFGQTSVMDGYSFVKESFGDSLVYHMGYVVRFLYRTDYLKDHNLFFPERVHWEDTVFMPKALLCADRVASISDVLYAYRVNDASISGVFRRFYPAKMIYEFAFCAGGDLLRYSDEVRDVDMKSAIRNTAIRKYINGFPRHLFRTNKKERILFYEMIRERTIELESIRPYMNISSRLLLNPVLGRPLANMVSVAYGLKHRKK